MVLLDGLLWLYAFRIHKYSPAHWAFVPPARKHVRISVVPMNIVFTDGETVAHIGTSCLLLRACRIHNCFPAHWSSVQSFPAHRSSLHADQNIYSFLGGTNEDSVYRCREYSPYWFVKPAFVCVSNTQLFHGSLTVCPRLQVT